MTQPLASIRGLGLERGGRALLRGFDLDIAGGDRALALLAQRQHGFLALEHAQRDALQVQQDFDHIFLYLVEVLSNLLHLGIFVSQFFNQVTNGKHSDFTV